MTSLACRPAVSAGLPGCTRATIAPRVESRPRPWASSAVSGCSEPPIPPPRPRPPTARLRRPPFGHFGGEGEADPLAGCHDRGVDADDLAAQIDQGAAGVARIDRGGGLDEGLIRRAAALR